MSKSQEGKMSQGGAAQRLLWKLEAKIEAGEYYEAHQIYRTLYFRLLAKESYAELLNLLFEGARCFLSRHQQQSGVDLAILYVEVLVKSKTPPGGAVVENLTKLFAAMDPDVAERETFLNNAIRWSKGDSARGDPALHRNLGRVLWNQKSYHMAKINFYNSDDAASLAEMLIEMQQESPEAVDIFITIPVLQMLCKERGDLAEETYAHYIEHHPQIGEIRPPFKAILLNFVWELLIVVKNRNLDRYRDLLHEYDPIVQREPYIDYMKKIGRVWFGLTSQKPSQNGIFGNLIQNILSGMEAEDNAQEDEPPAQASSSRMQTEDVE